MLIEFEIMSASVNASTTGMTMWFLIFLKNRYEHGKHFTISLLHYYSVKTTQYYSTIVFISLLHTIGAATEKISDVVKK